MKNLNFKIKKKFDDLDRPTDLFDTRSNRATAEYHSRRMSNQEEAIEDEIDSYELNDDFNNNLSQYSRSSTLLMDRFGDESPDEVVSVCVAYTVCVLN